MKKLQFLFTISIVLIFSSCILKTWDTRVRVINNSQKKIRYIYQLMSKSDLTINTKDCDTSWILSTIAPNNEDGIAVLDKWEFSLRDDTSKILRIYIYSEDNILKYGTCNVIRDQLFIKRFDLTYDTLEKLNWRVVYDGN